MGRNKMKLTIFVKIIGIYVQQYKWNKYTFLNGTTASSPYQVLTGLVYSGTDTESSRSSQEDTSS